MKKPKYIIVGNQFRMGWVELHWELAAQEKKSIKGGGYWCFLDEEKTELLLYGFSFDFGHVTKDQLTEVFTNGLLPPRLARRVVKVYHSNGIKQDQAKEDKDLLLEREVDVINN